MPESMVFALRFGIIELSVTRLLRPIPHAQDFLHLPTFITMFRRLGRPVVDLSERMLGVSDCLGADLDGLAHSISGSFAWGWRENDQPAPCRWRPLLRIDVLDLHPGITVILNRTAFSAFNQYCINRRVVKNADCLRNPAVGSRVH